MFRIFLYHLAHLGGPVNSFETRPLEDGRQHSPEERTAGKTQFTRSENRVRDALQEEDIGEWII